MDPGALSHPVRLAIIRALKQPRFLSEICISPVPGGGQAGIMRGDVLARQTVKQHLERLASIGIVVANDASRKTAGTGTEYALNPHALAVISETFEEVAKFFAKPPMAAPPLEAPVAVS